jgi:glutamine synthetase
MHFHVSPLVDGVHSGGFDEEGELRDPAKWLIAGLTKIGGALMAFGNRDESSFTRLLQGKEAPNRVTWGQFNRKALIRLPIIATDESGREVSPPTVEFRLPDGSAHPHLLLAGISQALLAGRNAEEIDALLEKTKAGDGGEAGAPVPHGMKEVAEELEKNRELFTEGSVFPEHVIDRTIELLRGAN